MKPKTETFCTGTGFSLNIWANQLTQVVDMYGDTIYTLWASYSFLRSFQSRTAKCLVAFLCLYVLASNAYSGELSTIPNKLYKTPHSVITAYPQNSTGYRAISFERLADAIFKAENSKRYPYGIIKPYCGPKTVAACRKGCLQTIEKRHRMWLDTDPATISADAFISYLSRSYAPLGAKNDPSNLNSNWIKNVRRLYVSKIA